MGEKLKLEGYCAMHTLKHFRLKTLLLFLAGIWATGLGLLAILGFSYMNLVEKEIGAMSTENTPVSMAISRIKSRLLTDSNILLKGEKNAGNIDGDIKAISKDIEAIKSVLTEAVHQKGESRGQFERINSLLMNFTHTFNQYKRLIKTGQNDVESYVGYSGPYLRKIGLGLEKLSRLANRMDSEIDSLDADAINRISNKAMRQKQHVALLCMLILAAGLSFSFLVFRAVGSKLKDTRDAVSAIATGEADLTKRVKVDGSSEVDEIATLLNTFIERMQKMIQEIKEYGLQMTAGAREVGQLSSSLASTAVEGNAQSEEVAKCASDMGEQMSSIAAAMEEMTATVAEIAQNTAVTGQKSSEVAQKTRQARELVDALANSSISINEMSSLIGNIAEQTNLLALNATIEAARAGEAGKGFAVVAGEVKELAKQTSEAVQKIDHTVEELQEHITRVKTVTDDISESIEEVSELANSVAAAVEEQTATTNEISENTQAVSNSTSLLVTQSEGIKEASTQTASGSEQARLSAGEMSLTAENLENTLKAFKV